MRCHYGKRFVPSSTIKARMDACDERFMLEQRRKFPHLFAPVVECALVRNPDAAGPLVEDVQLVPAKIDGGQ